VVPVDVIVERGAGLDVGKDEVVACVRTPRSSGKGRQAELRVFPTFTSSLEERASPRSVEASTMRSSDVRDAKKVRPRVP
jgi:hypothetical protein